MGLFEKLKMFSRGDSIESFAFFFSFIEFSQFAGNVRKKFVYSLEPFLKWITLLQT